MATIKRSRWNAKTDTSSALRTVPGLLIHGRPRGKVVSTIFQSLRIPGESTSPSCIVKRLERVVQPFRLGRWWAHEVPEVATRTPRGRNEPSEVRTIKEPIAESPNRRNSTIDDDHTPPQASAENIDISLTRERGLAAVHFGFTPLRFYRDLCQKRFNRW